MISTTIKKKYFDMKMEDLKNDGFFIEYKEDKPFWEVRIDTILKLFDIKGRYTEIVFLVGNIPYCFWITSIKKEKRGQVPLKYMSAIKTENVWAIKCVPLVK